jgi:hypothetical protein
MNIYNKIILCERFYMVKGRHVNRIFGEEELLDYLFSFYSNNPSFRDHRQALYQWLHKNVIKSATHSSYNNFNTNPLTISLLGC